MTYLHIHISLYKQLFINIDLVYSNGEFEIISSVSTLKNNWSLVAWKYRQREREPVEK